VCGEAQVHGKARVYGGAVVSGGAWGRSPLQIQGTWYFFSVSSDTELTIGCKTRTVHGWLAIYEQDFQYHGFTEEQRVEYQRYFNLAAAMYGWDVPLFNV
jgi:hypothetical protein